jgi:GxxExxY protein
MERLERPDHDPLTDAIIGAAFRVRTHLGVGLLESAYHAFLVRELRRAGFDVTSKPPLPVTWDGLTVEAAYRPDIIVNHSVVIELKAVKELTPVDRAQLLTYLRFLDLRTGLLLNFHSIPFKAGIKRVSLQGKD